MIENVIVPAWQLKDIDLTDGITESAIKLINKLMETKQPVTQEADRIAPTHFILLYKQFNTTGCTITVVNDWYENNAMHSVESTVRHKTLRYNCKMIAVWKIKMKDPNWNLHK